MTKMRDLQLPEEEINKLKNEILHKEGENLRKKRQKITIFDFEPLNIIGKGAFGEVRVCRYIPTGDIVAIKKMKKDEMHKKSQVLHVRAERDVLSEAKNPWIVDLKFSFQDQKYLYLGMEFLPGGDLMSLLMVKDILPENDAKFYAAELVCAIESVHNLNCIHRDLKPDNVLIGADGHIKLSDFGLSKKIEYQLYEDNENEKIDPNNTSNNNNNNLPYLNNKNNSYAMQFSKFKEIKSRKRRAYAFSTVGTPDYIAPEVFSQKGYGPEVDWWSLGVIMFEMMIGFPPFFGETSTETCKNILNWKNKLEIPPQANISNEAIDIIINLITDVEHRLGYHGADEIKKHPYFKGINWDRIKETLKPPFIPKLKNEYDTKYFDVFEEDEPFYPIENNGMYGGRMMQKKDMCFVDFTYNRNNDNLRNNMVTAFEVLDSIKENLNNIEKQNFSNSNVEQEMKGSFVEKNINNNNNSNSFRYENNGINVSRGSNKSKSIGKKNQNSERDYNIDSMKENINNNINNKLNSEKKVNKTKNFQKTQNQPQTYSNIKTKLTTNNYFSNKSHYIPVSNHKNNNNNNITNNNNNNISLGNNVNSNSKGKNSSKGFSYIKTNLKTNNLNNNNNNNEIYTQRNKIPKMTNNNKVIYPQSAINTNKIHSNYIYQHKDINNNAFNIKGKNNNNNEYGYSKHNNVINNLNLNNNIGGYKFLNLKSGGNNNMSNNNSNRAKK